jgi:hypothetical protein
MGVSKMQDILGRGELPVRPYIHATLATPSFIGGAQYGSPLCGL